MKQILGLLLMTSIISCSDRTQTTNTDKTTPATKKQIKQVIAPAVFNPYGFDTTYDLSNEHTPCIVTGFFNSDEFLDTAIIVRHKTTGKDALFIKHGGTDKSFMLKNGKEVGSEFPDYNWIGQFEVVKKGTKIWDNVFDGEIVGEDQVPDNKKILLTNDGIFVHVDEASGGGIIYYNNGKYIWVQQD